MNLYQDYSDNLQPESIKMDDEMKYARRRKLLDFYVNLLAKKGLTLDAKEHEALSFLIISMTEEYAAQRLEKANWDEEEANIIAQSIQEVIEATMMDDLTNREVIYLNGNNFVYDRREINIEKYKKGLIEIGKETQNNTWELYLDSNGELVIY